MSATGIAIHSIPGIIANPTKSRNLFSEISVKKAYQFPVYFFPILCYNHGVAVRVGLFRQHSKIKRKLRRFLQSFPKEALIKSARAGSERFCSQARFGKWRNTLCTRKGYAASVSQLRWQRLRYISHFSNRRLGAKDPLSSRGRFIQSFPNQKIAGAFPKRRRFRAGGCGDRLPACVVRFPAYARKRRRKEHFIG